MSETVTALLYLLKDMSACAVLFMIFRFIFVLEPKPGRVRYAAIAAAYVAAAFCGNLLLPGVTAEFDETNDFVSNVLCILSVFCVFKGAGLLRTIITVFLSICTADMFYSLFSPLLPQSLIAEYAVNIVFFLLICLWLYLFAVRLPVNSLPGVFDEIPKWIYAVILIFELTCYYKEFGASADWYRALYIFSSAAVTVCMLYLVLKVFIMAHRQNQIIQQLNEQKVYGENAVKGDEELRRFRHDFKNHMIVVNTYLKNGKAEEAGRYIAAFSEDINSAECSIKTGNFVADAILNNKAKNACAKGIGLSFIGFIPPFGIKDEDLSTIISNLVDNAIEACEKLEEKSSIEIEANVMNNFFVFGVSNPIAEKTFSGSLKTTKPNRGNHGYGLGNVKRAAEKYGGVLVTDASDDRFSVDLRLKLQNDERK